MFIYKITNKVNGKIYIGQTSSSLEIRWRGHKDRSKTKCNYPLYRSIRKYGIENFHIELLQSCNSREELLNLEIDYIKKLNSLAPNGYNLCLSAGGNSLKTIKSKNLKTNEILYYSSISEAVKNGFNKVLLIKTLSKYKTKYKNCLWTYENAEFVDISILKRTTKPKKILQININTDIIKEFSSLSEAARKGFDRKSIYYCCSGKQKAYNGFYWKYKD